MSGKERERDGERETINIAIAEACSKANIKIQKKSNLKLNKSYDSLLTLQKRHIRIKRL